MTRRAATATLDRARSQPSTRNPWPEEYRKTPNSYIWGTEPSLLACDLLELLGDGARVLDLGCGEGRDSVFFAANGHEVTGLDCSDAGLDKAEQLAHEHGVSVRWVQAAAPELPIQGPFDLVYSCGSIHYVPRQERQRLYRKLRALTAPGGLHAHVVLTDTLIYREKDEIVEYFWPGELASAYDDWTILREEEGLIPCDQDGTRHVHSIELVLARGARPRLHFS